MTIENFLSRLEKVRKRNGKQWMACCPACGDKHPSLSIKDSNGTILIHCFAQQCTPSDICSAIGMEVTELFPPSDNHDASKPAAKRQFYDAANVLESLAFEALVLHVISNDMVKNGSITDDERDRLAQASIRINAALEYTKRVMM